MNREDASSRYVRPVVADYGDLARITADVSIFTGQGHTTDLSFSHPGGAAGAAGMGGAGGDSRVAPAGIVPGHLEASGASAPPHAHGGAGDTLGAVESLGGGPSGGGPSGGGAGGGGTGSGGAGSGSGGGGGELPFTGFLVATLGAVGAGMAASGVRLRRALRRDR